MTSQILKLQMINLINKTSQTKFPYDDFANFEITDDQLQMIKEVKNIEAVYPHVYLYKESGYFDPNIMKTIPFSSDNANIIKVIKNNEIINTLDYRETLINYLNISPVYPHHKIQERCSLPTS